MTDSMRLYIRNQREAIDKMQRIYYQSPSTVRLYAQYSLGSRELGIRAGSVPPLKAILRTLPDHLRAGFTEAWDMAGWAHD